MTEKEFIQIGKQILDKMSNNFDNNTYKNISSKFDSIYLYIKQNPNNIYVNYFISELIDIYINLFLNKNLINALSLPDREYFYKQIQIYINLPYTLHIEYAWSLPYILDIPSTVFGDYYETFSYVLQKYRPNVLIDSRLQAIFTFTNQNKKIMNGFKDTYYSLEKEIELYNKPEMSKEYEDFLMSEQLMNSYSSIQKFMNKRIGNIGESYVYNSIKNALHKCFVARDIKNGFGYDIYFMDKNSTENLIEVKSTTKCSEDDYFSLSENEYKVMKECLERENANYYLCRVKLDKLCNFAFSILYMKDNITFIDTQNQTLQYKLHPSTNKNAYFMKYNPKI